MADHNLTTIIERYVRAYEEHDYDTCEAMFADDAVFEDPVGVGGRRFAGIAEIRGFLRSAPPEIRIKAQIYRIIDCGTDGMFHYEMEISGWKDVPIGCSATSPVIGQRH